MDIQNLPAEENKFKSQQIKVEVLQIEESANFHQEGQYESYLVDTIKIEDTVLNPGISKYECNICEEIFTDESSLKQHFNENHQDGLKHEVDQYAASTAEQQEESRLYKNEYNNLEESSETMSELTCHAVDVECDEKLYKCEESGCILSFKSKKKLNQHKKVHSNVKPFKCEQAGCSKSFKMKTYLNNHMRVHSEKRPYKCQESGCTMSLKSKQDLKVHMLVHTDIKAFKCQHPKCSQSFKLKSRMLYHMKSHSDEKPFNCNVIGCKKSFKTKVNLNLHMKAHSSEKPFSCPHTWCGKSFKHKISLDNHMRLHVNQKIFECTEMRCRKQFKSLVELISHLKVHSNERASRNEGEESTVETKIFIKQEYEPDDGLKNVSAAKEEIKFQEVYCLEDIKPELE